MEQQRQQLSCGEPQQLEPQQQEQQPWVPCRFYPIAQEKDGCPFGEQLTHPVPCVTTRTNINPKKFRLVAKRRIPERKPGLFHLKKRNEK